MCLLCPANRSNAVVTRRLFLFRLGRQREHDTSDDTDSSVTDSESNSGDDKTELSCSDSEIDNTEATSMQAELSDDSVCELDGFSSLFNEDEGTDLVEDDASDSGDDQESSGDESNSGDNNIELRLSDSESADDNTEPAETEPVVSDDSVCKLLDGFSSLFGEREESDLSEDDEFDSDNDQESSEDESNNEDNNIELGLSDSESADDNTEPAATEPVMSDDSVCKLLDGFSSLFGERGESDLSEDDEFDSDNDQESSEDESNNEDNNIELGLSDSESVDDDTEPTATEPELPDDSVCEYLDGFFSLFYEHGESDLGVDDEFCYQHADDERKSVDNEDADAVINYDQLQSCLDEDSLCLLDGVSTLFEDHRESESDFPDDEERIVSMLGESKPEDKQEPTVQSTPEAGHWDMAIKSLKIAAGVAGVGLALYAAYKYFR